MSHPIARWGLFAVFLAFAVGGTYFCFRWAVAETVVHLVSRYPIPADAIEKACEFDPLNPEPRYLLGAYYMDVAAKPDLDRASELLESAALLGPNRFEHWIALGRCHELRGELPEAEQAFARSRDLAPLRWRPEWVTGNLYLREGRIEEGLQSLAVASHRYSEIAPLAVRTAWLGSEKNLEWTRRVAGDSVAGGTTFVHLLLSEDRPEDAAAVWTDMFAAHSDDAEVRNAGNSIAQAFLKDGRASAAADVWQRLYPATPPRIGEMLNGGFDEPVSPRAESPFVWALSQATEARLSIDEGRNGGKALRIDYAAKGGQSFTHATELVLVEPGRSYLLTFWVRTENLATGGAPAVVVRDATGKTPMSVSVAVPDGSAPWTERSVSFVAPESGAILVVIERRPCGEVCPIFGKIWIDAFAMSQQAAGRK